MYKDLLNLNNQMKMEVKSIMFIDSRAGRQIVVCLYNEIVQK